MEGSHFDDDTMAPVTALRAAIDKDNFLPLNIPVRFLQGVAETAAERSFRISDDLVAGKSVLVHGTAENDLQALVNGSILKKRTRR